VSFDHDGNKMFSVTPHFKDGRHLVVGIKETKFNGRRWYLEPSLKCGVTENILLPS
jgi:hypothetical protein